MSEPQAPRILLTMTFGERLGGCENFLWTFLRHVDRARLEPVVLFHMDGPFADEVRGLGIETHVIEQGRFRRPDRVGVALLRTRDLLTRLRPALILSWYTRAHVHTAPAALAAGMGGRLAWFQHTLPGGTDLDRIATLLPARAIAASSAAGAAEQARMLPRRPVFTVLPGIDDPVAPSPERLGEMREDLGIPAGRSVVGVVGRLLPWKQQHLVVEAVDRLRQEGHDVHGLVVGGDAWRLAPEYERDLRELVAARGLEPFVTLTGHVPDATAHIALMDVLVNSSTNEPFGIVLVEALALGTPVVAFDAPGGPREILDGGRCGVLADPGEPDALARAAARILGDTQFSNEIVARGKARYESSFTSLRMTRSLEEWLLRLAVRSSRRSRTSSAARR